MISLKLYINDLADS